MAREKSEVGKTGVYHILLRGVNNLFLSQDDYTEFFELLKRHTDEKKINVIAYVFLKNRIHLVIDILDGSIGAKLKPITTSYARYCNRTRNTTGKLFYDRFKSEPIDTKEALLGVVSFINAISVFEDKEYQFSSLSNPIGSLKQRGLTKKEAENTAISHMYIEDYDCLTKSEISEYIFAFCGIYPKEYKSLTEKKKTEIIEKLTQSYWISKTKIYELLGEQKNKGTVKPKKAIEKKPSVKREKKESQQKTSTEKAQETVAQKQKKKALSVWLL